jgi:hypothetical protein
MIGQKFAVLTYHSPLPSFRTILYAPFIPFIVIFCYVIETLDPDDLGRLRSFSAGLEDLREVSEPINKLHRMCNAVSNVATMYVETKRATTQTQAYPRIGGGGDGGGDLVGSGGGGGGGEMQDQTMYPAGMEFDMYLRDLGLMPGPNGGGSGAGGGVPGDGQMAGVVGEGGQVPVVSGGVEAFHSAQLGDWFSGNLSMMGMLERDLTGFSPSSWQATTSPNGPP